MVGSPIGCVVFLCEIEKKMRDLARKGLNAVDKFLFNNFKEEIDVVTGRIFSKINTSSDIMNQIFNLFVDPLISGKLDAANASNLQDDVPN